MVCFRLHAHSTFLKREKRNYEKSAHFFHPEYLRPVNSTFFRPFDDDLVLFWWMFHWTNIQMSGTQRIPRMPRIPHFLRLSIRQFAVFFVFPPIFHEFEVRFIYSGVVAATCPFHYIPGEYKTEEFRNSPCVAGTVAALLLTIEGGEEKNNMLKFRTRISPWLAVVNFASDNGYNYGAIVGDSAMNRCALGLMIKNYREFLHGRGGISSLAQSKFAYERFWCRQKPFDPQIEAFLRQNSDELSWNDTQLSEFPIKVWNTCMYKLHKCL